MKNKYFLIVIIFVILSICLFQSCEKDCPVCPVGDTGEPGNYRLYVLDSYNQYLMSVDTPADTIVDSTRIDYYGAYIFVTPDGEKLLVMRFDHDNGHKMEVYNASDLSHIETLEQYGLYDFDGGDNYGIWNSFKKVYFINPTDLTPFDSIDFNLPPDEGLRIGYLDTTSNQYFVATSKLPDNTYKIFQIDCISRQVIDSIITPVSWGGIGPLAYNWLTDDLYFLTTGAYFRQYDLTGDSLISSTYISHITGSISVSPDGLKVYMTDGGDGFHGEHPVHPIWIFDALTHQPTHWITPYDTSGNWVDDLFGQIILTPDNKRAYLAGNSTSGGGTPLTIIDLELNRIVGTIDPFKAFDALSIALGPVPNN